MDRFRLRYGPWALVAGASEGIGAAFADQIAAHGVNLVLMARRVPLLASLQESLRDRHGVEVRTVAVDLVGRDALEAALRET